MVSDSKFSTIVDCQAAASKMELMNEVHDDMEGKEDAALSCSF